MEPWKLLIDTGGTFTDCFAHAPTGELHRIKVLSNSSLRGKIIECLAPDRFRIHASWLSHAEVLADYTCSALQAPGHAAEVLFIRTNGIMQLNASLPGLQNGDEFVLQGGEEAPILAARLATRTPRHQPLPPMQMRLGSTKGTNALLERKGSKVCLLITKGLADLPDIGDQTRPDLFALNIQKAAPLHSTVLEVNERLNADGTVHIKLEDTEIERLVSAVTQTDCDSVAIALLHAYLNPQHERRLADALRAAGMSDVSCSSQLVPAIKLLPRAATAVVNAYLSPVIRAYLQAVTEKLTDTSQLYVMTSAGGLVKDKHFHPKDSLLSGPAGGVVGAAAAGLQLGRTRLITLDMGGTSTDVARIHESFEYAFETRVGAAHILSPSLAIETVAAGGGSICQFDGQKLTVGPESAGAWPGPACYGAGGPLTLTDVNLLLGRLVPRYFGIPIDRAAAQRALDDLRQGLAMSAEEVLHGCLRIANEKMAEAIRRISVRRGYAPSDYSLLAFGGAGAQHACQVAALLDITEVLVPYDAGLLSAWGMGQAAVERFAHRQILQPFRAEDNDWQEALDELDQEVRHQLQEEGYAPEALASRQWLYLRFLGQDYPLEIPYEEGMDVLAAFEQQYRHLFGHWLSHRSIEIESIKVMAFTSPPKPNQETGPTSTHEPTPQEVLQQGMPVFHWEQLASGAILRGPCLLVSPSSTTVVEAGWTLSLDRRHLARLARTQLPQARTRPQAEEVQLELFTNRFRGLVEEMGALMERTAFSVNVKERKDFSCALLDAEGELVANAPHIPVHLGSMGVCVRQVAQALELKAGDVAITNHPGFGGSHLPDVTLVAPVFDEAGKRIAYVANRAHHAEIGGKRPGSMPADARNLAEEGVVIPPMLLVKQGEPQWEPMERLLSSAAYPTRALEENITDLRAGLASIQTGIQGVLQLHRRFGDETLRYMQALKAYASRLTAQLLVNLPKGTFEAEEYLDDGSPLRVGITIEPEGMTLDFSGSAEVHPGNFNANPAIVNSAVLYVLRLLLAKDIPLNEGIMKAIRLVLPEGMLNPAFPPNPLQCPAVVGGNVETSQRLVDLLLKALGNVACSQGSMNNLLFGNDRFGYYETIGGGTGAGPGFDGAHGVHQHMTNTRITDPEVLEFRYPVRLEQFSFRSGSGGAGKWKGGDGLIREITFLEPVYLTVLTQHRIVAPYGKQGGEAGAVGRQFVLRANGTQRLLNGVDGIQLQAGDRVVMETPGGGGYGNQKA